MDEISSVDCPVCDKKSVICMCIACGWQPGWAGPTTDVGLLEAPPRVDAPPELLKMILPVLEAANAEHVYECVELIAEVKKLLK